MYGGEEVSTNSKLMNSVSEYISSGFNVETLSDRTYSHSFRNADPSWKHCNFLPTPPCSPDNQLCQGAPRIPLQLNPGGEIPEDLVDIPQLILRDGEMESLAASTNNNFFGDYSTWTVNYNSEDTVNTGFVQGLNKHRVDLSTCGVSTPPADLQPITHEAQLRMSYQFQASSDSFSTQQTWTNTYRDEANNLSNLRDYAPATVPQNSPKRVRKRPRRASKPSPSPPELQEEEKEDSETIRATHNVLERQRREDLKHRYKILRGHIPELEDNERAPKVTILKKAREYVEQLKFQELRLQADKELEKQRRLILFKRLQVLKQGLYK